MELVKYHLAESALKRDAARLALTLIVAGKKNAEIISNVETACGIELSHANINSLRKRDDVMAAIQANDKEALQTGIATKARRIEILEEGIELLYNTFVITDELGIKRLRTEGNGIKGQDAVSAVKTMADIIKVASEVMEPKKVGGGVNVQINNGSQVANFNQMLGIGSETDVLAMLKSSVAALETQEEEARRGDEDVIDVAFEDSEDA